MRYINNSELKPGEKWLKDAMRLTGEARKITEEEKRAKYINKNSKIWKDLKTKLEDLSHRKCWYCESLEIRSDRTVDHYRPKNNVKDTNHGGYWWLAFRHDNFRLSCTFCNCHRQDRKSAEVGGKGDYFPLWDEGKRVCHEKDDNRCKYEDPLLLDPCKRSDIELLWFSDDGRAISRYSEEERLHAFKKADVSIKHYHLNEVELKEARLGLLNDIKGLIEQGDFYFEDCLSGEPNAEKGLSGILEALDKILSPESEFTGFAKAVVSGYRRTGREWLDAI